MLIFDTNVASELKRQPEGELKRFWTWIYAHHRYAIAPTVLAELLKSLRDKPEQHLEEVRREFSALRGPRQPIMLPLQGIFLARTLFGIEREHPHVPAKTMASVLEAGRRLKRVVRRNGLVLLVENPEYPAIVLNYLIDPIAEGEESMFAALEATKETQAAPLDREEWARRILHALDLPTTAEPARILADACRAAYTLQRFLWTQAKRGYNPRKHSGDWMDHELLLYLAYPKAVFVSCEKRLPTLIAGSG